MFSSIELIYLNIDINPKRKWLYWIQKVQNIKSTKKFVYRIKCVSSMYVINTHAHIHTHRGNTDRLLFNRNHYYSLCSNYDYK